MQKAPEKFRFAAVAVDIVVFGIRDNELCVLVDTVHRPPHYDNIPGFPGAMVLPEENTDEAAARVLRDKAQLQPIYLEQLYTFSDVDRDARNRVVSVAYVGCVRPNQMEQYQHVSAAFVPLRSVKKLAYDHSSMLQIAEQRLAGKLDYTTIAQFLLATKFTLTELQTVYEIILRTTFDKRNFRKKILALDIVTETGDMQSGVQNRPAALYKFTKPTIQKIQFLG